MGALCSTRSFIHKKIAALLISYLPAQINLATLIYHVRMPGCRRPRPSWPGASLRPGPTREAAPGGQWAPSWGSRPGGGGGFPCRDFAAGSGGPVGLRASLPFDGGSAPSLRGSGGLELGAGRSFGSSRKETARSGSFPDPGRASNSSPNLRRRPSPGGGLPNPPGPVIRPDQCGEACLPARIGPASIGLDDEFAGYRRTGRGFPREPPFPMGPRRIARFDGGIAGAVRSPRRSRVRSRPRLPRRRGVLSRARRSGHPPPAPGASSFITHDSG